MPMGSDCAPILRPLCRSHGLCVFITNALRSLQMHSRRLASAGQNAFCAVTLRDIQACLFSKRCGSLLVRVYSDTQIILAKTH